jgi:hypothetical protein
MLMRFEPPHVSAPLPEQDMEQPVLPNVEGEAMVLEQ